MFCNDSTSTAPMPIKQELIEVTPNLFQDPFYCRCCFKIIEENDFQVVTSEKMARVFQEMIELTLLPSPQVSSFCGDCSSRISDFSDFRKLAVLKQQKFNEILLKSSDWDFTEIHQMNLPTSVFFKSEPNDEVGVDHREVFKSETFKKEGSDEPYDPLTPVDRRRESWWLQQEVSNWKSA